MPYDDLRKGRFSETNRAYFVTCNLADRKTCLFSDFKIARLLIAEMKRLHDEGDVFSFAWVIMPDHLHWLFQLQGQKSLVEVMKTLKARSARKTNLFLGRTGSLWQKAYYDHALREQEDVREIARYIAANPLRAGLVDNIGNYPHWDAMWL